MKSWLFKNRIPISWISTLPSLYVFDRVQEFIPYHLHIATNFFAVKTWLEPP